jgi:AraC-like DNA-binding protein
MIINPDSLNGKYIRIDNPEPSEAAKTILYVKQAGFFTSDSCPPYRDKKENCLFFMMILKGSGVVKYDNETHIIKGKQCVFIDCCLPHYYYPDKDDPWEVIWLAFGGNASKFYYDKFTQKKFCVFIPQNYDTLHSIMNNIIESNLQKAEDLELINAKHLTDLMTAIITNYSISTGENRPAFKQKLSSVKEYVDKHFTELITLDKLAEQFYISKFYLTREFKKEYGSTVIQYALIKRIEYAKELLANTNRSVEEIAEICGFNDQSYFARQFKRSEKITCLGYRKKHSGSANKE